MAKIRKDNKGRNLHVRESQRADGRYLYTYMLNGKRRYVYDTDLHRLREKERQIEQDLYDGIRTHEAFKLTLNDGSGTDRTVASGIALYYKPDELIGKKVIVVSNLKPATLCGVESHGMILAADTKDGVSVLFAPDLPIGSKLR